MAEGLAVRATRSGGVNAAAAANGPYQAKARG